MAITRISTAADGAEANHASFFPVFSPDGSKVAFESRASNLVSDDTNDWPDIFVKDLDSGAIELISTTADGTQVIGGSGSPPAFSPDGSRIAFASGADNLVPGDTNNTTDIFVKDLDSGAIELISTTADGTQGDDYSDSPVFSPVGSRIAFASGASNLVPNDTNSWPPHHLGAQGG